MMTAELRSPHQRRSDHLSILTRRPPPPQSHGRFLKTFTEVSAGAISTFDPAFDSDADTEGPASGSSIWRREFSRVVSTSSAASVQTSSSEHRDLTSAVSGATGGEQELSSPGVSPTWETRTQPVNDSSVIWRETGADHEILAAPKVLLQTAPAQFTSFVDHDTQDAIKSLPEPMQDVPREEVEDHFLQDDDSDMPPVFSRERARSFYGRRRSSQSTDGEASGDRLGPMSRSQLRKVLDEDYDMFYSPKGKKFGSRTEGSPKAEGHAGVQAVQFDDTPSNSHSPSPHSPELSRNDLPSREVTPIVDMSVVSSLNQNSGGRTGSSSQDAARSRAPGSSQGSIGRRYSSNKLHSLRVKNDTEALTVSILSDCSDDSTKLGKDDKPVSAVELDTILRGTADGPRLSSGTVPLFVEEIGRMPRVAVVDGKVQRVKVSKASYPSFRFGDRNSSKSRALQYFSSCLTPWRKHKQSPTPRRAKSISRPERPQSGGRPTGWFKRLREKFR